MKTEREMIDQVQDGIASAKKALKELQKENAAKGRHMAANAAMGLLGELNAWHAKATEALDKHYPELTSGVTTRGGGDR